MKRKYFLCLIPISILCILLAKMFPTMAEYVFARGLFCIISVPIGFLTGLFPFSLAEMGIYALFVGIIVIIGRVIWRIVRKQVTKQILIRWLLNVGVFFSIVIFLFVILCGTNYYRYDFEKFCDFTVEKYSKEDLYNLCVYLAEKANETKKEVEYNDEDGIVVIDDFSVVAKDAKKAYENMAEEYPVFRYSTGRAKPVLASKYMSYTDIVGIYIPFTMEANVNVDVAGYNRPADTCHELAHLHGFMKENEANFISYLVCTNSENKYFQYSGYMMGLIYATNALYKEDVALYGKISEMISDEIKKDLAYEDAYWDNIRSSDSYEVVSAVSDKVNDTYLKANGQENGVKSYGEMVDLLIANFLTK